MTRISLTCLVALFGVTSLGHGQALDNVGGFGGGGGGQTVHQPQGGILVVPVSQFSIRITFDTEFGSSTVNGVAKQFPKEPIRCRSLANGNEINIPFDSVRKLAWADYWADPEEKLLHLQRRDETRYRVYAQAERAGETQGGQGPTKCVLMGWPKGQVVVESGVLGECAIDVASIVSFEASPWRVTSVTWPQSALKILLGGAEVTLKELSWISHFSNTDPRQGQVSVRLTSGDHLRGRVTQWPVAPVRFVVNGQQRTLPLKDIARIEMQPMQSGGMSGSPFGGLGEGGLGGGGLGGGF